MPKTNVTAADFIVPLDMNGLSGRMLHMPAPNGKAAETLFVYGQHSSLERWWGLMQYMNRFTAVTAPDLPGIGGMDSFYKIGKKPTIDNFADYLAAFVKMRYKRKKVVIVGMSLGFVIATRMLQRYPELKKNVELLVSLVGLAHADDLRFSRKRYWFYRILVGTLSHWPAALFFRYGCLNSRILRTFYHRTYQAKSKFAAARSLEEHRRFMDVEVWLWQHNDVRTHAVTTREILTLDNCRTRVDMQLWHVVTDVDQYLDVHRVEQHLRVIFTDVHIARSKLNHHAPSIIANEQDAAPLIPPKLRRVLARLS
jgi:pimeloyl-ACP methyl ester carboxylesterase